MAQHYNADGLMVRYGLDRSREVAQNLRSLVNVGPRYLIADWEYNNLPRFTTDANNNGTLDQFNDEDVYIPSGSFIVNAFTMVQTAFAGGTSYDVGLYQTNGTVIDADGIDNDLLVAQLAANEAVIHDGTLVAGTILVPENAHLVVAATGTFTAGKARTIIEYMPPRGA